MTPQELIEEAGKFGDLVTNPGWKALMVRVHDFLVSKNKELGEMVYKMAFAKTEQERIFFTQAIIDTKADLKAVSVMFSIPMNVIDQALEERERLQGQSDPEESVSSNGHKSIELVSR